MALDDALDDAVLLVLGIGLDHRLQRFEHLGDRLEKFRFIAAALLELGKNAF